MILEIVHDNCPEAISDDGPLYREVSRDATHEYIFAVLNCTRCLDRIVIRFREKL